MIKLNEVKSKVALCLSGQFRTFDECFPFIQENLIECNQDNFQIDLFGYFTSDEEIDLSPYPFTKVVIGEDSPLPNLNYHRNKYSISAPVVENVYHQLFKMKKSNELRKSYEAEHNIEYDYIARLRSDFKYLTEVDFSILRPDTVFIPYEHDHFGLNDRFAIGSRNVMDIYLNRFDFWIEPHPEIPNYTTHVESNLKILMEINNINIDRIPFSYCLSRADGDADIIIA